MADEKAAASKEGVGLDPLAKMPDVIRERRHDVELSDKSIVRLERWALGKYARLAARSVAEGYEREVAVESVIPEDREKVSKLDDGDIEAIVAGAIDFNYDKERLKKALRLGKARADVLEAMASPEQ